MRQVDRGVAGAVTALPGAMGATTGLAEPATGTAWLTTRPPDGTATRSEGRKSYAKGSDCQIAPSPNGHAVVGYFLLSLPLKPGKKALPPGASRRHSASGQLVADRGTAGEAMG